MSKECFSFTIYKQAYTFFKILFYIWTSTQTEHACNTIEVEGKLGKPGWKKKETSKKKIQRLVIR